MAVALSSTSAAFVPPKPQLIFRMQSSFAAARGSASSESGAAGSRSRKRGVPGSRLFCIAADAERRFQNARRAERVAENALAGTERRHAVAEDGTQRERFHGVVVRRAGAVGVNVINFVRRDLRLCQRAVDGERQAGAIARRAGEMVGVVARAAAGKQNGRGRKQFALHQNNGRRAFAEAQADARFVKGTAAFGIKRFQRVETRQDKLRNQIHAGDENDVGQSAPDERRALLERAQAGNARGGNALHRAATIKRLRQIGGEKRGLNLPLRHGGNRLPADKLVQRLDVGLGGGKDKSAPRGGNGIQNCSGMFAASFNAAAAKRKARESA